MRVRIKYKKSGAVERAKSFEQAGDMVKELFPNAVIGGIIMVDRKTMKEVATLREC